MSVATLAQLRSFLTQISHMPATDQMDFVSRANQTCQGALSTDAGIVRICQETLGLLSRALPFSAHPALPRSLFWSRWSGPAKREGIGLLLATPRSRFLLLSEEPEGLLFDPPLEPPDSQKIVLIPELATLERCRGTRLFYIHRDLLMSRPRAPEDRDLYEGYVRRRCAGEAPSWLPSLTASPKTSEFLVEEYREGVSLAILAAQQGLDYLLGEVATGDWPDAVLPVSALAASYPDLGNGREALVRDERFLGGVDPRLYNAPIALRGRRPLKDIEGNEIGWAEAICGGAGGEVSDPDSLLSGSTSVGEGSNQEDSLYLARFRTRDGREVQILAVLDGLGGADLGEMASSAGVQGIHAGVVDAISQDRIALAGELFHRAYTAWHFQVCAHQEARRKPFLPGKVPDAVIAIAVIVDGEATIAVSGDTMVAYSGRDPEGFVETWGYSAVDATSNDHTVSGTLGSERRRLYRVLMKPGSWLTLTSDGLLGSLASHFKRRCSPNLRFEMGTPQPDQTVFSRFNHVLMQTPPTHTAQGLHDVSMGIRSIPGEPVRKFYPALGYIAREMDNKTAAVAYWAPSKTARPGLSLPEEYRDLYPVFPAYQYVFEDGPHNLRIPKGLPQIFIGNWPHPEGRPIAVLPDPALAPLHTLIYQPDEDEERYFIEKLAGKGRITLLDKDDRKVASLSRKGALHEIKPGYLVQLTDKTYFRFRND